jgi:subtilase family serine protease
VPNTVFNAGTAPTGVNTSIRFYLSLNTTKGAGDQLLGGTRTVTSLAAGLQSQAVTQVTIPASTPLGVYHVLACADDTSQVSELNEANNCGASAQTTQVTKPDLTESNVTFTPAIVARGTALGVSDTVTSAGPAGTAATTTRYYVSLDTVKSSNDRALTGSRTVPPFNGAGSSTAPAGFTVTVPVTVLPGSYYLIACADTPSAVAEASESNNCAASAIQLTVTP